MFKVSRIETVKKELEEKEKIFEEKYIDDTKHNDYLSEESCKMRNRIFLLRREFDCVNRFLKDLGGKF